MEWSCDEAASVCGSFDSPHVDGVSWVWLSWKLRVLKLNVPERKVSNVVVKNAMAVMIEATYTD